MAGFSVDTDAVKDFGRQIAQLGSDLSKAALSGGLSQAQAGSVEVSRALDEFHGHWRAGQTSLLDNLTELAGAINQSATGYDQSDTAVVHAAGGGKGT
ncbi:MAG: hypothetical protein QOE23_1697 [Pseudonocardiales bacterium]|jgi:uncharacterized phage infection (PIP) family protein YhgE|nr:hypothetical protein [Pseudonocardiales bacterium]